MPPPKLIFVGAICAHDDTEGQAKGKVPLQTYYDNKHTLHIIGMNDPLVPVTASLDLSHKYPGAQVFFHKGKHYVPQNEEIVEKISSFLKESFLIAK